MKSGNIILYTLTADTLLCETFHLMNATVNFSYFPGALPFFLAFVSIHYFLCLFSIEFIHGSSQPLVRCFRAIARPLIVALTCMQANSLITFFYNHDPILQCYISQHKKHCVQARTTNSTLQI